MGIVFITDREHKVTEEDRIHQWERIKRVETEPLGYNSCTWVQTGHFHSLVFLRSLSASLCLLLFYRRALAWLYCGESITNSTFLTDSWRKRRLIELSLYRGVGVGPERRTEWGKSSEADLFSITLCTPTADARSRVTLADVENPHRVTDAWRDTITSTCTIHARHQHVSGQGPQSVPGRLCVPSAVLDVLVLLHWALRCPTFGQFFLFGSVEHNNNKTAPLMDALCQNSESL